MKPTAIKLDAALLARVDAMAARMGEHRSTVMRIAMRVGLESLESAFEEKASSTLTLIKKSSASPYPAHRPEFSTAEDASPPPAKKPKAA